MTTEINCFVSYSTLSVFVAGLANPFNCWEDQHVAQGFAWRPHSVSFRTIREAGAHIIEVQMVDRLGPLRDHTVRAVEVPFDVPENGEIEVGSMTATTYVSLPTGKYTLRCEFINSGDTGVPTVRLSFATDDPQHFSIARADHELSITDHLLTQAEPAVG